MRVCVCECEYEYVCVCVRESSFECGWLCMCACVWSVYTMTFFPSDNCSFLIRSVCMNVDAGMLVCA